MKYRASVRRCTATSPPSSFVSRPRVAVVVKNAPRPSEREFLTIKEVSELLRVSYLTVRRLIDGGRLDAIRVGKQWRILRDSIFNLRE